MFLSEALAVSAQPPPGAELAGGVRAVLRRRGQAPEAGAGEEEEWDREHVFLDGVPGAEERRGV